MCSRNKGAAVLTAAALLVSGLASAQTATQSKPGTAPSPTAPVAGRATVGVAVVEMDAVIAGWSAKKDILKKAVVNDKNEKIGSISDVIISPSSDGTRPAASFAIIGVGGFLGIGNRDVAIPMEQIKLQDNHLVLPGATKDSLKNLPPFEYRKK
jgi:sporulation protein YlmC with PRC-barrel domain